VLHVHKTPRQSSGHTRAVAHSGTPQGIRNNSYDAWQHPCITCSYKHRLSGLGVTSTQKTVCKGLLLGLFLSPRDVCSFATGVGFYPPLLSNSNHAMHRLPTVIPRFSTVGLVYCETKLRGVLSKQTTPRASRNTAGPPESGGGAEHAEQRHGGREWSSDPGGR
jgi:hypothetical protein